MIPSLKSKYDIGCLNHLLMSTYLNEEVFKLVVLYPLMSVCNDIQ